MLAMQVSTKPQRLGPSELRGLDNEIRLLRAFLEFCWNEKWDDARRVFSLMPTVLLYGPPGTGKTSAIEQLAIDRWDFHDFYYYKVGLESLLSPELGASSKNIYNIFGSIKEDASNGKKVLLHLDDIDSLLSSRHNPHEAPGARRAINSVMLALDDLVRTTKSPVPVVMATTNIYDAIDAAVARRFSLQLLFMPNLKGKELKLFIGPMCEHLGVTGIDHEKVEAIVEKQKLMPYDMIRVFQKMFLNKVLGAGISEDAILAGLESEISAHEVSENQHARWRSDHGPS